MKKLLFLFFLRTTYAVDCPICNKNLIEISASPNIQSKNIYACSNKHSFQLTTNEFTQFDQANSTEKSKINYYTPKIMEKSKNNYVDQSNNTEYHTLVLNLGLIIGAVTALSLLI